MQKIKDCIKVSFTGAFAYSNGIFIFSQRKNNIIEFFGGSNKEKFPYENNQYFTDFMRKRMNEIGFEKDYVEKKMEKINFISEPLERQFFKKSLEKTGFSPDQWKKIYSEKFYSNKVFFKKDFFVIQKMSYVALDVFTISFNGITDISFFDKKNVDLRKVINPFFSIGVSDLMNPYFLKKFQNSHRKAFLLWIKNKIAEVKINKNSTEQEKNIFLEDGFYEKFSKKFDYTKS